MNIDQIKEVLREQSLNTICTQKTEDDVPLFLSIPAREAYHYNVTKGPINFETGNLRPAIHMFR
jgi:hypothetical protein